MKAENYLLQHIIQHDISIEKVEKDTGINIKHVVCEGKELIADDFIGLCIYLGITPEEVSDQIL